MALKKCRECGKEISSSAKQCPQCGVKAPAGTSKAAWVIAILFGLVVYMFIRIDPEPSPPGTTQRTVTPTAPPSPVLRVVDFKCGRLGDTAMIEGRVRNVSGASVDFVQVVGSFYTADDEFITSDFSYIDIRPLLPNQVSTFKVLGPRNPSAFRCRLDAFQSRNRQLVWDRED